jgi:hypothetical protein
MSKRNIMIVGLNLPWPNAENVSLTSNRSLLDGDIIVIHPVFSSVFFRSSNYQGKPCYDDSDSFQIRECFSHWRNQITAAYNAGKTIIVMLVEEERFFIATGQTNYSGTGRNARATRLVEEQSNYASIPYNLTNLSNAVGTRFSKAKNLSPIEQYWHRMESSSQYCVTFNIEKGIPLLSTPDGSKTTAAYVRAKGTLIFVPDFIYPDEELEEIKEDGKEYWTKAAVSFAGKMEAAFVDIDRECRNIDGKTPPPDWTKTNDYRLPAEGKYEENIENISKQISELQTAHDTHAAELDNYKLPKALLYEQGKPLEKAVRSALAEMGFNVTNFDDGEREFDAVFTADGFRLLGEVEGKDTKPINIDKMSQLERNINEDFERDEISEHAIGVLFGNAYRLTPPTEREDFFTPKVIAAARRSGVRLVKTTDLFKIVSDLRAGASAAYKEACRKALFEQRGAIVVFPISEAPSAE